MRPIPRQSLPEEVAVHLREGIRRGDAGAISFREGRSWRVNSMRGVTRSGTRRRPRKAKGCWADLGRKGNSNRKTINIPAEFVPGGSIGPVWMP